MFVSAYDYHVFIMLHLFLCMIKIIITVRLWYAYAAHLGSGSDEQKGNDSFSRYLSDCHIVTLALEIIYAV